MAESVTVAATAPLLRPTDSSSSTVINQTLISDLPLSGRKYTDFVLLTPNANADCEFGLVSIGGQQGGADSGYANGNGSNSFTVDGANDTSNYFGCAATARSGTEAARRAALGQIMAQSEAVEQADVFWLERYIECWSGGSLVGARNMPSYIWKSLLRDGRPSSEQTCSPLDSDGNHGQLMEPVIVSVLKILD